MIENRPELGAGSEAADLKQEARAAIGLLLEDSQPNLIKGGTPGKAFAVATEKVTLTPKVSFLKQMCEKRCSDGEDSERHEVEARFERLTRGFITEEPSIIFSFAISFRIRCHRFGRVHVCKRCSKGSQGVLGRCKE